MRVRVTRGWRPELRTEAPSRGGDDRRKLSDIETRFGGYERDRKLVEVRSLSEMLRKTYGLNLPSSQLSLLYVYARGMKTKNNTTIDSVQVATRSFKVLKFVEFAMPWAVCVELATRRHTFADRLSSATETSLGMSRLVSDARTEPLSIRNRFATALPNRLGKGESGPGDQWASQSHYIPKPRRPQISWRSGFMRAASQFAFRRITRYGWVCCEGIWDGCV